MAGEGAITAGAIPDAAWGLIGAVIGGTMATIGGFWLARVQQRAELAQRNRIELYEPALRELRKMESLLKRKPFPDVVVLEATSPAMARSRANRRSSLLDVSWWRRQKDGGAHLRAAPSVAGRLDSVVDAAELYLEAKRDFTQLVNQRISKETESRKESLKERFGEDAGRLFLDERQSLLTQFLRGEQDRAEEHLKTFFEDSTLAEAIVVSLIEDSTCTRTREAAHQLALRTGKAAAILENQISKVLKRFEKRNEKV